jgi:hypothetical protein
VIEPQTSEQFGVEAPEAHGAIAGRRNLTSEKKGIEGE